MSCNLTRGRSRKCKLSEGGQRSIYLFDNVEDPFTVVNGVATAINPLITQVHEYELEGDGNTLNEVIVSDRNTGSSVNTQTLVTVLKAMDVETTNELNLAAYGFPMCVVRDRNGNFLCVGIDDGIDFTIDKATGGAKTDLNGYTMTGVSTTGALSPHMDDATRDAFLLLVSS